MKRFLPFLILFLCNSAYSAVVEIDFTDGIVPNYINKSYSNIAFENFRFFKWSGNSGDVFPFIDSWGAVIDSGLFTDLVGRINFPNPVDYFEVDGVINNSNFDQDVEWNLTAFDNSGNVVDFVSSGLFDPVNQNGAFHIFSTLRVEGKQSISRVLIDQQIELGRHREWGLDTVRFQLSDSPTIIPEPSSLVFLVVGLVCSSPVFFRKVA